MSEETKDGWRGGCAVGMSVRKKKAKPCTFTHTVPEWAIILKSHLETHTPNTTI